MQTANAPVWRAAFQQARFGIFVHFGLYTVLGKNENAVRMGSKQSYAALMKRFNPVRFDAHEWVRHVRDAGANYLVLTAKHAEGFCLWDSGHTPYTVCRTPFKRDLLAELATACARHDLPLGLYYNANTWLNRAPDGGELDASNYADFVQAQLEELLTGYGPICALWFDHNDPLYTRRQFKRWLGMARRLQPACVINDRGVNVLPMPTPGLGDFATPERHIPDYLAARHPFIECCDSMTATSWGYQRDGEVYSTPALLRRLSLVAGLGGNYLLNVSPLPDGRIQPEHLDRLSAIGAWLRVHKDAILGTQGGAFVKFDPRTREVVARSTQSADHRSLYVHLYDWPTTDALALEYLSGSVTSATLLGSDTRLRVASDPKPGKAGTRSIRLRGLPSAAPMAGPAVVRIRFRQPPEIDMRAIFKRRFPVIPVPDGETVRLTPDDAEYNSTCGIPWQRVHTYPNGNRTLCHWVREGCFAKWKLHAASAGVFTVYADLGTSHMQKDAEFEIRVGKARLRARTRETGWYDVPARMTVGQIPITPGRTTLILKVLNMPAGAFSDVHGIVLQPSGQKSEG